MDDATDMGELEMGVMLAALDTEDAELDALLRGCDESERLAGERDW